MRAGEWGRGPMALDSYMYGRDPMLIVQERQERELRRSCKGCQHTKEVTDPFGGKKTLCTKGRPYGKRCRQYQEVPTLTQEESDEIEVLLETWYRWERAYTPALGYPRAAPYARITPPERGNVHDDEEAIDERLDADLAEQVAACINSLPRWQHRAAIGLSMANKHGPKVFRSPRMTTEETYAFYIEAKALLMPMLRQRELLRA